MTVLAATADLSFVDRILTDSEVTVGGGGDFIFLAGVSSGVAPLSAAEFKNQWNCDSTSPCAFMPCTGIA